MMVEMTWSGTERTEEVSGSAWAKYSLNTCLVGWGGVGQGDRQETGVCLGVCLWVVGGTWAKQSLNTCLVIQVGESVFMTIIYGVEGGVEGCRTAG